MSFVNGCFNLHSYIVVVGSRGSNATMQTQ